MFYEAGTEQLNKLEELTEEAKVLRKYVGDIVSIQSNAKKYWWEYMEIVEFTVANEHDIQEGYRIVNSSGEETREFNEIYPNIVSVLNYYGSEGWEVISVRELEVTDKDSKIFSARAKYTFKR